MKKPRIDISREEYRQDSAGEAELRELEPPATAKPLAGLAPSWLPAAVRSYIPAALRHVIFHISHRLAQAVRYEGEVGTGFLVLPISFGIGAIVYFALPREPLLTALIIAIAVSGYITNKTYGRLTGNIAMVMVFLFAGMTAGKLRSEFLDTSMIERPQTVRLTGLVLDREARPNGRQRYTIAVKSFERPRGVVPGKVRITAHAKYPLIDVGKTLSGLARLQPPSGPAYPGAYDFAFYSWFNGIGANGFFLGAPVLAKQNFTPSFWVGTSLAIAKTRAAIGQRIREILPGESGNLAAALIVGDRSGISEETSEALRRSGLAHILAISGLHMALVTATVIMLVRGSLALIPGIALYYPIRKWAALAAMAAASIYLLISGAGIATQRAWVMITIMLLAILFDRRALTMRNVGLAALVVLAWRPESIVSPSFQMSFAAVAALVAVYEAWSRHNRSKEYAQPSSRTGAVLSKVFKSLGGLAVTSLVAGLATGLFAAYHFYRIAPLGLLANLAAMPVVTLAVMPMALLSMILMPFGLEAWPLAAMGIAIDEVVGVAGWISSLATLGDTGFIPLPSLVFGTIALIVATQFKSILRYFSVLFLLMAVWLFVNKSTPDILVSQSGESVAIVDRAGEMHLLNRRKEKFTTKIWQKAFAPGQGDMNSNKQPLFQCDALGCAASVENSLLLTIAKRPEAFREDCRRADIIITKLRVPESCTGPKLIIDQKMLSAGGAVSISIVDDKNGEPDLEVSPAFQSPYRPWTRHRR